MFLMLFRKFFFTISIETSPGGAMTLSITTFSITTLSIMTLSITTFSITTLSIMTFNIIVNKNGTLSKMTLSRIAEHCYAECHI